METVARLKAQWEEHLSGFTQHKAALETEIASIREGMDAEKEAAPQGFFLKVKSAVNSGIATLGAHNRIRQCNGKIKSGEKDLRRQGDHIFNQLIETALGASANAGLKTELENTKAASVKFEKLAPLLDKAIDRTETAMHLQKDTHTTGDKAFSLQAADATKRAMDAIKELSAAMQQAAAIKNGGLEQSLSKIDFISGHTEAFNIRGGGRIFNWETSRELEDALKKLKDVSKDIKDAHAKLDARRNALSNDALSVIRKADHECDALCRSLEQWRVAS
jgi:hypothetical protein